MGSIRIKQSHITVIIDKTEFDSQSKLIKAVVSVSFPLIFDINIIFFSSISFYIFEYTIF